MTRRHHISDQFLTIFLVILWWLVGWHAILDGHHEGCLGICVAAPLLVLPFLARLAGDEGVEMTWGGGRVAVGGGGVAGDWEALAATPVAEVRFAMGGGGPVAHNNRRVPLARATVDGLAALAMQITVPATDQSRSDAGAMIDDND